MTKSPDKEKVQKSQPSGHLKTADKLVEKVRIEEEEEAASSSNQQAELPVVDIDVTAKTGVVQQAAIAARQHEVHIAVSQSKKAELLPNVQKKSKPNPVPRAEAARVHPGPKRPKPEEKKPVATVVPKIEPVVTPEQAEPVIIPEIAISDEVIGPAKVPLPGPELPVQTVPDTTSGADSVNDVIFEVPETESSLEEADMFDDQPEAYDWEELFDSADFPLGIAAPAETEEPADVAETLVVTDSQETYVLDVPEEIDTIVGRINVALTHMDLPETEQQKSVLDEQFAEIVEQIVVLRTQEQTPETVAETEEIISELVEVWLETMEITAEEEEIRHLVRFMCKRLPLEHLDAAGQVGFTKLFSRLSTREGWRYTAQTNLTNVDTKHSLFGRLVLLLCHPVLSASSAI